MSLVDVSSHEAELRRLVDQYRSRCLWFLREDYYPLTAADREWILDLIERHGDLEALRRVTELRTWLSRPSSGTSAVS